MEWNERIFVCYAKLVHYKPLQCDSYLLRSYCLVKGLIQCQKLRNAPAVSDFKYLPESEAD